MKVIMTGGGTGGHIYPAIAIAEEIKRRDTDAEIIFVGTNHGMEKDIVPRYGYELKFITVSGLNRKKLWKNVQTVRDLKKGTNEARAVIREFQPDLVIGTGGYVCGPMVRTAAILRRRTDLWWWEIRSESRLPRRHGRRRGDSWGSIRRILSF